MTSFIIRRTSICRCFLCARPEIRGVMDMVPAEEDEQADPRLARGPGKKLSGKPGSLNAGF